MSTFDRVRRVLGAMLVTAAAAWPILSATGQLRITEDKLNPSTAGPRVLHMTRGPGPQDLAPALLVGLLLWLPDAVSIAIPGMTITRRLEEADQRLDRMETSMHAQQQMAVTMVLGDPDRLPATMREKAPLLDGSTSAPTASSLWERWQQLHRRAARYEGGGAQAAAAVTRWRTVFADELAFVETAITADALTLTPSVAQSALGLVGTLETYLEDTVDKAQLAAREHPAMVEASSGPEGAANSLSC